MTDTQAKSGTASAGNAHAGAMTATDKADSASAGEAAMTGPDSGAPAAGGDAGAVNRGSMPGETTSGGTPKFMRAPGMVPPPDSLTVPMQAPPSVATGKASVSSPPPIALPPGSVPVSAAPMSGSATGTA